jgi:hypothetical protein
MYLAEIHGKFSPREEKKEDILTSKNKSRGLVFTG